MKLVWVTEKREFILKEKAASDDEKYVITYSRAHTLLKWCNIKKRGKVPIVILLLHKLNIIDNLVVKVGYIYIRTRQS